MATQSVLTEPTNRGRGFKQSYRDSIVGIPPGAGSLYMAYAVITAFPNKTPTWQELAYRFGMSRATAGRHRAALKAARGEF